jgi:hypothetical protein
MASRYEHPIRVTDERIAYITKYQEEHKLSSRPEALDVILGKAIDAPPSPTPAPTTPRTDGRGLTIPDELRERVMGLKRVKDGGLTLDAAVLLAIDWGVRRLNALDGWAEGKRSKGGERRARKGKEKGKAVVKEEAIATTEPTAEVDEGPGEVLPGDAEGDA